MNVLSIIGILCVSLIVWLVVEKIYFSLRYKDVKERREHVMNFCTRILLKPTRISTYFKYKKLCRKSWKNMIKDWNMNKIVFANLEKMVLFSRANSGSYDLHLNAHVLSTKKKQPNTYTNIKDFPIETYLYEYGQICEEYKARLLSMNNDFKRKFPGFDLECVNPFTSHITDDAFTNLSMKLNEKLANQKGPFSY